MAKEEENTGYYDTVTGDDYNQNNDNLYDNAEAVQVSMCEFIQLQASSSIFERK